MNCDSWFSTAFAMAYRCPLLIYSEFLWHRKTITHFHPPVIILCLSPPFILTIFISFSLNDPTVLVPLPSFVYPLFLISHFQYIATNTFFFTPSISQTSDSPLTLVPISILQFVPSPISPLKGQISLLEKKKANNQPTPPKHTKPKPNKNPHSFPLFSFKPKHFSEILQLTLVFHSFLCTLPSIQFSLPHLPDSILHMDMLLSRGLHVFVGLGVFVCLFSGGFSFFSF